LTRELFDQESSCATPTLAAVCGTHQPCSPFSTLIVNIIDQIINIAFCYIRKLQNKDKLLTRFATTDCRIQAAAFRPRSYETIDMLIGSAHLAQMAIPICEPAFGAYQVSTQRDKSGELC
jgi:hypothetical protein